MVVCLALWKAKKQPVQIHVDWFAVYSFAGGGVNSCFKPDSVPFEVNDEWRVSIVYFRLKSVAKFNQHSI